MFSGDLTRKRDEEGAELEGCEEEQVTGTVRGQGAMNGGGEIAGPKSWAP